jgi:hypothetical protein
MRIRLHKGDGIALADIEALPVDDGVGARLVDGQRAIALCADCARAGVKLTGAPIKAVEASKAISSG